MLSTVAATLLLVGTAFGQDSTQYWHERYHGLLSMASYGDFATTCPQTFTQASLLQSYPSSTEAPFTILSQWGPTASGISGFNVQISEMDKVVMVFGGLYGWEQLNMTSVPITALNVGGGCANATCKAHAGALQAYLEAKEATNDWEVVKAAVNSTGHQWSITGHGFGGMVAQVAALDLGWRGLAHWSHNHGAPRVFNPASANVYDSLFQGEASQRCVANNDSVPTIIPESDDYTFTLEGFHIYGTNVTYGMNYYVCVNSPTDPNCLGGTNITDHDYYYTGIGHCGESYDQYNATYQNNFESSESSSFYATATSTWVSPTITSTPSSLARLTTTVNAGTLTSTAGATLESGAQAASTSATAAPSTTKASESSVGVHVGRVGMALVAVAIGVMVCL
ncbi:alpha/beta-hydrolase [Meredithblackwellia eburnea MCA 4105]